MAVEDGDELVPGCKYIMKVWRHRNPSPFKAKVPVTFVSYCDPSGIVSSSSFNMADLRPGLGQTCVLVDTKGDVIVLKVLRDIKIWVTDNDDRVTFDIV